MPEKIKIYDGSVMLNLFKEYIESLKVATEALQTAFSNISEFQKPLDMVLLKQIIADPTSFFHDLQWKGQKWASSQRPMAQAGCSSSAKDFVDEAQSEYSKWSKIYHSERPKIDNRSIPLEVMDISNLDGLISEKGFSDKWFKEQSLRFNEYLEDPQELEYWKAMNDLAASATKVAQLAGHWAHKADPIKFFLIYDPNTEVFTPIIDGLKRYVSTYGKVKTA